MLLILSNSGLARVNTMSGNSSAGGPWRMLVFPLVPVGALRSCSSEMEIGVEPAHGGGLQNLTSISVVTLSAYTLRNIVHLLPW